MKKTFIFLTTAIAGLLFTGCYYSHPERLDPWDPEEAADIDSMAFRTSHHYWKGFNFEATDTLRLATRPPTTTTEDAAKEKLVVTSEAVLLGTTHDMVIRPSEQLVVADILYIPTGTSDTIWVKVARDQLTQGWVGESQLMNHTVVDTPISKFIYHFSDRRTIIFISILGVFVMMLILTMILRRKGQNNHEKAPSTLGHILRQTGISAGLLAPGGWQGAYRSFYPTLLCLTVSAVTTLYCSIQHFVPATWVEYYFHPTLNPFSPDLPPIMQLFVGMVWLLVVVSIAVILELAHEEEGSYLLSHLAGLACVCVVIYLILTLTVSFYVGYLLLLVYWAFALHRYFQRRPARFRCGMCGQPIEQLGICPHCGADNK